VCMLRSPRSRIGFVTEAIGALSLLLCSFASGQTFHGTIVGTITDSSGGMVVGANVTLTNLGTGDVRKMATDPTGGYQFLALLPGNYGLAVEQTGFKRFVREPIVVEVNQTVRISVSMVVGALTESVTVTAQTPLLQTETSSLGQVVAERNLNQLPLNGRNPLALAGLVPGVVPQGGAMLNSVGQNMASWGNYQIGGGQAGQSAALVDGAPLNISWYGNLAYAPAQDAMQEFKVETNSLSSEFGRLAGGVINFVSKSGTNGLHGTVYEFLRNKVLNANTFFSNASGIGKPPYTQNQFGGGAGGPVVIPGVYNGRNKTFWFFNYDEFRMRQGVTYLLTVPTVAMRNGDFSGMPAIYDPLNTTVNAQGVASRQPFSNNVIPTTRIDPTAAYGRNLWALPNLPGGTSNFATNASAGGNLYNVVLRGDHRLNDTQSLFVRYTDANTTNLGVDPYKTGVCQDNCGAVYATKQAVLGYVYNFRPSVVLDVRLSYLRFAVDRHPYTQGIDVTKFGWPSSLNQALQFTTIPMFSVSGYSDLFSTSGGGSVLIGRIDTGHLAPKLTVVKGGHTIKFGGEYRRMPFNFIQVQPGGGTFSFSTKFTALNYLSPGNTGIAYASFLLGMADSGSAPSGNPVAANEAYHAAFVEDSIRAGRKLTLIVGLRYDYMGTWTERFDRLSLWMPSAQSPVAAQTGLPLVGRLGLVNSPDRSSRRNRDADSKQFGPRFGVAYRLTEKTVLRAGYGVYWLPADVAYSASPHSDSINSTSTQFIGTLDGSRTPYNRISNPFPSGILTPPGRAPSYQSTLLGQSIGAWVPNVGYGYAQQWNFNVQRQLPDGTLIDLSYAGSKGTHLPMSNIPADQLPDQYMSMGSALTAQVANPFYNIVSSGTLSAATVAAGQLLRPFPQYTGVSLVGLCLGDSIYHSFQAKLERRFKNGASILVSYTAAKLIGTSDTLISWAETASGGSVGGIQNAHNLRNERSLASFDTPQRLVVSYVLDLPVGAGGKYLRGVKGPVGKLVSGWGAVGAAVFQRGFPINVTSTPNTLNNYGGGLRPNFDAAACPHGAAVSGSAESRLNGWFNTACFVAPPAFTYGNVSRTLPDVRQDGITNVDLSVFKNTAFGPENKLTLQVRAEFFNLLNTAQFGTPGGSRGTTQFGVVSKQFNDPRLIQLALRLRF
jgi:hypothetical protein